jgi:NAD(P)-dependent dehydrogenase (short-subunit alcohol dehydrogenase family)
MADHNLAIIVGVGPGLGGAISRRFAAAGHPVAMAARSTGATNQIAAQIEAEGGQAKGYVTDATNETSVVHLFDPALAAVDDLISIKAIAETYYQTHLQPRSAWSSDCEVRPWNRAF